MSQEETTEKITMIDVENIGGIDKAAVEFDPGVTILTGRNATNRTSFLQAVMAGIGSEKATLKADADEGGITLVIEGETYSRRLTRDNGRVTMDGDPYLDDPILADLFAFLLETNECRQAVGRDDDLRELIMRPVDTDEIEREIRDLRDERGSIDTKLSDLDNLSKRLSELEQEKQQLQEQIEAKESELLNKQEELESIDKSIDESRAGNNELDTKMAELQETRTEFKSVQRQIESEQESIEALHDELDDQQAAFDELTPISDDRISNLNQDMQRMRGQIEAMDQTINELQSVIQFNDELLDKDQPEIVDQLQSDDKTDGGDVTDQLLEEDGAITCWTCGTDVATEQIKSNLESLRSLRQQKMQDRQSLKQDIQEFQSKKTELKEQQQRHEHLNRTITQTKNEIADREDTLESMQDQKEQLSAGISTLESEVERLQQEDHSDILEVKEEVNQLEFILDTHTTELSDIETEIDSIEDRLDERDKLEARREDIQDEIDYFRMRVEQLQEQAIEEFNEHMEAVLDLLNYDNLDRIWIERSQETVREGRRKVETDRFNLHVVRSTDSDTVYEDTVDHLSESEREVTGLVFALAGYLVHEVYQTVPFMLIDSIEAIDAERIANLVDYLEGYADYLVVALLDEDAAALDDSYPRITSI